MKRSPSLSSRMAAALLIVLAACGIAFSSAGASHCSGPALGSSPADSGFLALSETARSENLDDYGIIHTLAFSPDSRLCAVVFTSSKPGNSGPKVEYLINVWNIESGSLIHALRLSNESSSLRFSPDGKTLAAGCRGEVVELWDVKKAELVKKLKRSDKSANKFGDYKVEFSPDGSLIATNGFSFGRSESDFNVRLWDIKSGKQTAVYPGNCRICKTFSPDGRYLSVNYKDGAKIIEVSTGKTLKDLSGREILGFLPDSRGFITEFITKPIGMTGRVDMKTLKEEELIQIPESYRILSLSKDGNFIVADHPSREDDPQKREDGYWSCLWDLESGKIAGEFWNSYDAWPAGPDATAGLFSADGTGFVTHYKESCSFWDTRDRKVRLSIETGPCCLYELSPDSKILATAAGDTDEIKIWDVSQGKPLHILKQRT